MKENEKKPRNKISKDLTITTQEPHGFDILRHASGEDEEQWRLGFDNLERAELGLPPIEPVKGCDDTPYIEGLM